MTGGQHRATGGHSRPKMLRSPSVQSQRQWKNIFTYNPGDEFKFREPGGMKINVIKFCQASQTLARAFYSTFIFIFYLFYTFSVSQLCWMCYLDVAFLSFPFVHSHRLSAVPLSLASPLTRDSLRCVVPFQLNYCLFFFLLHLPFEKKTVGAQWIHSIRCNLPMDISVYGCVCANGGAHGPDDWIHL